MIYTKVNNKQEIKIILSALVAMGHSIHSSGMSVEEFTKNYGDVINIQMDSDGTIGGGWMTHQPYYISQGEFLLEAARTKFQTEQSIKLNDSYTAIVSKKGTTVGCQTFDNAIILKVAEAIKKLDK